MSKNAIRYFLYSASLTLMATALAKLISSFGSDRILDTLDPVFQVKNRHMFRLVALFEIVVALYCVSDRRLPKRLGWLAWLSGCFVAYRGGLLLFGDEKPCPCLGHLTSLIHISDEVGARVMTWILVYFIFGICVSTCYLRFTNGTACAAEGNQH
jgi:hypothetical protein